MRFNERGEELPDPTPVEIPAGCQRPETLNEQIARLVRTQMSVLAGQRGLETFEESFDFDVDDDDELPLTGHELVAMKLEIGKNGEGADGDSRDGEVSGDDSRRGADGASGRGKRRSVEDDGGEDDRDIEERERRGTPRTRGGRSRGDSGSKVGREPRARGAVGEEVDD